MPYERVEVGGTSGSVPVFHLVGDSLLLFETAYVGLAGRRFPGSPCPLPISYSRAGIPDEHCLTPALLGSGGLSSAPRVCTASTLPTGPSPQAAISILSAVQH